MRAILLSILVLASAYAQTSSTEVLGTVIDATGAVVPRAAVTLLRVATGERRHAVTTSSGDFTFPLIVVKTRNGI